jgi:hypothetical protein
MVRERGDEDAENDRKRLAKARRENEGQELGLVADFREGDDAGRDEKRFQDGTPGRTRDVTMTPRRPR